jgi:hypothetical protein
VERDGVEPAEYINKTSMEDILTIGLGETHYSKLITLSELEIVRKLAERTHRPLKHLVIEQPAKKQVFFDKFKETGDLKELDKSFPGMNFGVLGDLKIYDTARKNNVTIHCVGGNWKSVIQTLNPFQIRAHRDKSLHENTSRIAQSDPDGLTVAIFGSHHISSINNGSFQFITDYSYKKLDDLLPGKHLSFSYLQINKRILSTNGCSLPESGLLVPSGIDTQFDETYYGTIDDFFGNQAGIIFIPKD